MVHLYGARTTAAGIHVNQQRVVHLDHLFQQQVIIRMVQHGRGRAVGRVAGVTERFDIQHAGLMFIQGPFTEFDQADGYQLIHQLEHFRREVIVTGAGNEPAEFGVEMRAFQVRHAAAKTHVLIILDPDRLPGGNALASVFASSLFSLKRISARI